MTDTGLATVPATVIAQRCAAQLLSGSPARRVVDVVDRLLAVQGQDPRGARLAIRARTAGLFAADVDMALTADRSLLITWLNRGTLHLVRWLEVLSHQQIVDIVAVNEELRTQNSLPLETEPVVEADGGLVGA